MSTTYSTRSGDTFAIVSRNVYGVDDQGPLIAAANPGVLEPFTAGITLTIPPLANSPTDLVQVGPAAGPDEVAILIDQERFRFWESVTITRAFDSIDQVDFTAPFELSNQGFREAFRPFSYKPVDISIGGMPYFAGTMMTPLPSVSPTRKTVNVSCYARPGVLADCPPSASSYPVEFLDLTLDTIAKRLAAPFGIGIDFEADPGAPFQEVSINEEQRILPFLATLAKQRNIVIGSTAAGRLRFAQSAFEGNPVAVLAQSESPLIRVEPVFNSQAYYGSITGIEPVLAGLQGAQITEKNPYMDGNIRPFTFVVDDANDGDAGTAVAARMGRMFGNMVSYNVQLQTWRDSSGGLWEPNTFVRLDAPDAMVYSPYNFLIRRVTLNKTPTEETAELNLVLPGAFSGQIPESLPWA